MSCEKCLFLCGALVVEVLAAVGGGLADSCFPSVLDSSSQPVVAKESDRAKLKEVKIPPIRRSSQFVPPYPRPHQRLRPT